MNAACRSFRRLLERALEGTRDEFEQGAAFGAPRGFGALSWHGHLTTCADCRALLEAEESLEILLATLPEPKLPARLVRRVLARLRQQESVAQEELDSLLALDTELPVPLELGRRVLQGLAAERAKAVPAVAQLTPASPQPVPAATQDEQLDRLLNELHSLTAQSGLAARVLAGLADERKLSVTRRGAGERALDRVLGSDVGFETPHDIGERVLRGLAGERRRIVVQPAARVLRRARMLLAFAAAVVLLLAAWALWPSSSGKQGHTDEVATNRMQPARDIAPNVARDIAPNVARDVAPDSQMLASLDVLEQWDMLNGDDVDLLLSTLPTADEALLEFQDANDAPAKDKEPERPSKG